VTLEFEFRLAAIRAEVDRCHDLERLREMVLMMTALMEQQKRVFDEIIRKEWG